jgi:acyl carrier protein
MSGRDEVTQKVVRAVKKTTLDPPDVIDGSASLVMDLGFDSLRVATLSVALEAEFGELLLLNEWIAASNSPYELNIDSLVAFVSRAIARR